LPVFTFFCAVKIVSVQADLFQFKEQYAHLQGAFVANHSTVGIERVGLTPPLQLITMLFQSICPAIVD